jgi:hypothetical protein
MATRTKRIATALQALNDELRATYSNKDTIDRAILETALSHLRLVENAIKSPDVLRTTLKENISPFVNPPIITGVSNG